MREEMEINPFGAITLSLFPYLSFPVFLYCDTDRWYGTNGFRPEAIFFIPDFFGFAAVALGMVLAVALPFSRLKDRNVIACAGFLGSFSGLFIALFRSMM
jgi:hypothetical protein